MGIDLLELGFRIEKQFGASIDQRFWTAVAGRFGGPDVQAGDLLTYILSHPACPGCGYALRGHAREDVCPECGRPFSNDPDQIWAALQGVIAEVANLTPARVQKTSLLIRDLGMS